MIDRLALIAAIAAIAYFIAPGLAQIIALASRARLFRLLRERTGTPCAVTGLADGKLVLATDKGAATLTPRKTRFILLSGDGRPESLPWDAILSIDRELPASVIAPEKWRTRRAVCVFHANPETLDMETRRARIAGYRERRVPVTTPVKKYAVAAGAFAEFAVFFESLREPGFATVSVLALVAACGKALPYCPPGLFLTLLAHAPYPERQKKSRRRAAVGFLLMAIGVALNVAVIFFVIRQVGFPFP
ncbi:MAG TPA: hypothetical protein PKO22_05760 [Treponemataceae bacterium]|nr:hypothetical protein [Treponemataceae bacterium]